ncbi:MAG: Na+/H+ antiporter NhaC [Flavobacteriales bacterium]|nr:Na+/H+ antiporter NhaC [Flavobacteriales bacterium]
MSNSRQFFLLSLLPVIVLILLLAFDVMVFSDNSSYGPNQIALLVAAFVSGGIGILKGIKYKEIYNGIVESISSAMGAIIILLLIGALAGTWLLSGVIPAMMYYGLDLMSPAYFLIATAVICAIVSLATGSSWSTIATVGVALLGIGQAFEIGSGWIAGAIISGAYFGDKMSPLSDTTNLAPSIAGSDLFTHIKHMMWTTTPSFIIALVVFFIAGTSFDSEPSAERIEQMQTLIHSKFNFGWWLILVPATVVILLVRKVSAIIGTLVGGIFAMIFQQDLMVELMESSGIASRLTEKFGLEGSGHYLTGSLGVMINSMALETAVNVPDEGVAKLLTGKGMNGMLNTVWLIICALTFGGVMQATGMLQSLANSILRLVKGIGGLVFGTATTALLFNILASDQYLAIVVPGKMFQKAYRDQGLAPENLSRVLEDSGTVTSVLVPWNTCGVAQSTILGISTGTYLVYCVFNYTSFFMTILFGFMRWKITKSPPMVGSEGSIGIK